MSLPRPAPLADLPALTELNVALDSRVRALRSVATHVRSQDSTLGQSWTSPAVGAYRAGLTGVEQQLARSAGELEGLAPALRATRSVLEAGQGTYSRLLSEWNAIGAHVEPDLAADLRRRIRVRYDALVAELEASVRSLSSSASSVGRALGWEDVVGGGLRGTWLGAVLTGAPTSGWLTKRMMNVIAAGESRARLPAWLTNRARTGHAVLDRLRVPGGASSTSPFTDMVRRARGFGRAPVVQYLMHDTHVRSARTMTAAQSRTLGVVGRYSGMVGRRLGVVGTVATVATVPGNIAAARERHIAAGHSPSEASALATEDVAFRTGGEVGGALVGAKGGAMAGAAVGSFVGPVGTVAGAAIGGALGAAAGSQLGGVVGDKVKDGFRSARGTVGNVASSVGDAASNAASSTVSAVSNAASGARDLAGSIAKRIF